MSGITLRDFQSVARLDPGGKVRISSDDENKLVNKGTFGHGVASWFRKLGERITGAIPDPTRAQRQIDALDRFKEALSGFFSKDVAEKALGAVPREIMAQPLTGRLINIAIANAWQIKGSNELLNEGMINKLLPPIPPGVRTPEFVQLVGSLGVGLDQLTEKELNEFEARFLTLTGSIDLTSEHKEQTFVDLARQTLKQVHDLSVAGKLDQAIAARQALVTGLNTVMGEISQGRSPLVVLVDLVKAGGALDEHARIEGSTGNVDRKQLMQAALDEAMRGLGPQDVTRQVLKNALARDSSLRALLAQIKAQPDDELSPRQREYLKGLTEIAETIIEGIGLQRGPQTVSPQTDVKRLNSTEDLSQSKQVEARRAVVQLLDKITRHPAAPRNFLDTIKSEYAQVNPQTRQLEWIHDNGGRPKWDSVEVLQTMEQHVRRYAVRDRLSIDDAIRNMTVAITQDESVPPGLKTKLTLALSAIEEEFKLRANTPPGAKFNDLPQEDFWRLFVPQRLVQEDDFTKWHIEQREPGSLAGLQRGFRSMLENRHDVPQPLTAGDIKNIHTLGTLNTFNGYMLSLANNNQVDPEQREVFVEQSIIPTDFRGGSTTLTLRTGGEVTTQGLEELRQRVNDQPEDPNERWFELKENGIDGETVLIFREKTPQQCEERMQLILDQYYEALPQQHTESDKRQLIARTVQALYRTHSFKDGNSRTIVFTAMNRLLLDAGLSPAILPVPKGAGGFSTQEFSDEILKGQVAFQLLTRPRDVSMTQLIQQQLATLENEGMNGQAAIATLRELIGNNGELTEDLRNEALRALTNQARILEDAFYGRLQQASPFIGLKREDIWRLFGNDRVDEAALPQLEAAFDVMLSGFEEPLDVDQIEAINNGGPSPGFRPGLDLQESRGRIGDILAAYNNDIAKAETDTEKRQVIARATKALYDGKFFPDGNSQHTVFIVMNRMLAAAGLSPAMLGDPTLVGRREDIGDIALEIEKAQLNFRYHAKPGTTNLSTFLLEETQRRMEEFNITSEQALRDLRDLIDGNLVISEKDRLVLIDQITQVITTSQDEKDRIEDELYGQISGLKPFAGVDRNDVWRLVLTGHETDPKFPNFVHSRMDFEIKLGSSTVTGMERAYGVMLDGLRKGIPLTVDHVMAINDAGPHPGLRTGETSVTLDYGQWTPMARDIGQVLAKDPWFDGSQVVGPELTDIKVIQLPPKSPEEMQQKLQSILDAYHSEIAVAKTDEQKQQAIAKAIQDMYRMQLFPDGDRQSTVFIVMNRMLLEAGLPPGLYPNPTYAFGFSPRSYVFPLREGIGRFQSAFPPPIETSNITIEIVQDMQIDIQDEQVDKGVQTNGEVKIQEDEKINET